LMPLADLGAVFPGIARSCEHAAVAVSCSNLASPSAAGSASCASDCELLARQPLLSAER